MAITKKIIHKNKDGSTTTVDIGVTGKNVEEDSTHRFSTDTEKANWNDANNKKHTHVNKTVLDGITSALIAAWNNAATHISDTVKHITSAERTNWNSAKTKADSAVQTIQINGSTQTKTNGVVNLPAYPSSISGNAETANKLKTTRKIGNASFDGSTDISLSQIGAAATSHTHSSYVNQNAFSNVAVGNTTIAADSATDTLTLTAGSNVTLTPDATNDKITISATDTKFIHPSYTSKSNGLYKVTVDATGHISATSAVTKADITNLGIPAQDTNTTYGVATTGALGLVKSGTDITVDSSGNVSVVDDSHNHVISNVDGLQTVLNGKAATSHTHSNYVNQNAFSYVNVGNVILNARNTTDDITLEAGNNITLEVDEPLKIVTINATDTKYTHPTTSGNKHIPAGGSSGQILKWNGSGAATWADSEKQLEFLGECKSEFWYQHGTLKYWRSAEIYCENAKQGDKIFIELVETAPNVPDFDLNGAIAAKKAFECVDYAHTASSSVFLYSYEEKPAHGFKFNVWAIR